MDIENDSLIYWIWLSQLSGVGPITAKTLLDSFETPQNIYNASNDQIINLQGISTITANLILNSKSLEKAEAILNKCRRLNIKLLTYRDHLYKQEIRGIKDPPVLLYYRGNIIENSLGVAIVGARRCTEYGKKVAMEAAEFLANNNVPLISGMAKGIDGYSHTACLKAGGYTIAILGCGLDICYPKEHENLMQQIIVHGAVITEYPPGIKPDAQNFPQRNRLISAWCKKLLVVEAGEKSGSLITAAHAKKQNRQVFVAPGSIYVKECIGSNKLIEQGARIYLKPSQLIEGFNKGTDYKSILTKSNKTILKPLEKAILLIIKERIITIDGLFLLLKEDKHEILETISLMELEGKIINMGGSLRILGDSFKKERMD